MEIKVDPSNPVPIYIQILDSLKLAIASGELNSGDRLPSVRELAVELRLNPRTVSNAYRELITLGLAETRKGIGLFLTDRCQPYAGQEALSLLREKMNETITFARGMGFQNETILDEMTRLITADHN
ncbi:MAG: GntR family transcriptional regulator [Candidatus Wallbacteria bacterium HGW-Wallbacteria-1]|uniref:GntR family transcriptional regulator n=1 Tax=Candidatus Wallbacteria bacterium HGW-Wallbacteria-1 TaxID=2013854 RepID=A0A2N1PMH0_9BACT|nr:MAG: GntR family transcriptional regulator [Candidatus Wallbacteria bacterium HGW-Wallbacteria-1]